MLPSVTGINTQLSNYDAQLLYIDKRYMTKKGIILHNNCIHLSWLIKLHGVQ